VIGAIGARAARKYFLSAEIFDAAEAARIGLVHQLASADQLDAAVERQLDLLAKGGPFAQREAKQLALAMAGMTAAGAATVDRENAALIARLRASAEGQEGLSAFLDKRSPSWIH